MPSIGHRLLAHLPTSARSMTSLTGGGSWKRATAASGSRASSGSGAGRGAGATSADDNEPPTTAYQLAISHLNSLQSNAIVLQKLREKRDLLQETNIPETIEFLERSGVRLEELDHLNVIHISGTKGKGSTCAFVESILRRLGHKTGLYTSPHLVHASERIRINSQPIDEDLFAKYFFNVYHLLRTSDDVPMPAYFKFLTLMAFKVFVSENVDVAVVEVGIGGEYDSTNIISHPTVCGISTLDIDHTSILGSTLEEISWHKAGIMKRGSPVIANHSSKSAEEVYRKRAAEKQTSLSYAPDFSSYSWPSSNFSMGIAGEHQKLNVALALQLVRLWLRRTGKEDSIFADSENAWLPGEPYHVPQVFVEAIESCRWPGRSQILEKDNVRYFFDGAHTPKSMQCCSEWFKDSVAQNGASRKRMLVFQCTADRDPTGLLPYLKDLGFACALFTPTVLKHTQDQKSDLTNFNQSTVNQLARSQTCSNTWKSLGNEETLIFDCITSVVSYIEDASASEPLDVLVTGSLHLVGGVLSLVSPHID